MLEASAHLPGEPASVSRARHLVTETLVTWDAGEEVAWAVASVVSELATNAVLHARSPFSLRLSLTADRLRIEVSDNSPLQPHLRDYGDGATTGRGLQIVQTLCQDWGVTERGHAKTVWCELALKADGGAGGNLLAGLIDDEDAGHPGALPTGPTNPTTVSLPVTGPTASGTTTTSTTSAVRRIPAPRRARAVAA